MADHAKLSMSGGDRWMSCPGSVPLSDGIESKSSAYAEEGTLAHAAAEAMLLGTAMPEGVTEEMLDHTTVYVDHVAELMENNPGATLHVEKRVKISDTIWGTADAIVWDPIGKILYVRDLKYGAGVAVEVDGNTQLRLYALASLLTMGYPARTVDIGIVQPRKPHADGTIRARRFAAIDLMDFYTDVLEAAAVVETASLVPAKLRTESWENLYLRPSAKACQWCPASPMCPRVKREAQRLAKQVFAPGLPYDPKALADTLDFLPILEAWVKNVREFAYGEAEAGRAIPTYKLVPKVARRAWRDEATAWKWAEGLIGQDAVERKLKSPAAIEKLIDKGAIEALNELCVKESSGHTLVHDSDKREAIRVDAKAAFAGK